MLDESIADGINIVFGTYYVDWLISKIVGGNYEVFYAFTVLDFCENVRAKQDEGPSEYGAVP